MSKITFETSTLAACVKKADQVAPNRGSAFDKAAGIVIESDGEVTCVRATDTSVFYTEWISPTSFEGSVIQWRLPSKLMAQIIGSLPIGSGKEVTLTEEDSKILITSGRMKAKIPMMDVSYFPTWQSFAPEGLEATADVGGKINMVEWAAAKDGQAPMGGIYFDGEYVLACDKFRLARTPLAIPHLEAPVLVPANLLGGLIQTTGEVLFGSSGDNLLIMPDDHTQISTVLFGESYPTMDALINGEYPNSVTVKKSYLLEVANRVRGVNTADRQASMSVIIGKGEVTIYMSDAEAALMDTVEITGQCDHPRHTILFTPENLIQAVEHAPSEEVILSYDTSNPMKIFRVDGGSGYMAWVAVRKDT